MYTTTIKSQDEALTHLYFHCCLKDKVLADGELDKISEKLVTAGLNKTLNFKDEILKYREYSSDITDETEYLKFLVEQINPVNELALFSYCAELMVSDNTMSPEEEQLLVKIADTLGISDTEQAIIKKLMVQRKVVETDQLF